MQNRPSVSYLNKHYRTKGFFLSSFYNYKVPVIEDTTRRKRLIERLESDGYLCVYQCGYWHIFYKDKC